MSTHRIAQLKKIRGWWRLAVGITEWHQVGRVLNLKDIEIDKVVQQLCKVAIAIKCYKACCCPLLQIFFLFFLSSLLQIQSADTCFIGHTRKVARLRKPVTPSSKHNCNWNKSINSTISSVMLFELKKSTLATYGCSF